MEGKKVVVEDGEEKEVLPGFRFHPTDEELVGFYLRRKVERKNISIEIIKHIDIYKYDPWDLPKACTVIGHEKEWYFFCLRERKYRNSVRPNRVTGSGFWKATGIDRPIHSSSGSDDCIGLKKSLVYYRGSAGKGAKTDWMMHEFRLPKKNDTAASPPSAQEAKVSSDPVGLVLLTSSKIENIFNSDSRGKNGGTHALTFEYGWQYHKVDNVSWSVIPRWSFAKGFLVTGISTGWEEFAKAAVVIRGDNFWQIFPSSGTDPFYWNYFWQINIFQEIWTICRIFKRNVSFMKKYTQNWKQAISNKQVHADSSSKSSSFESDARDVQLNEGYPTNYYEEKNYQISRAQWNPAVQAPVAALHPNVVEGPSDVNANEPYKDGNWDELGRIMEFMLDNSADSV